jgi:hypothetical protein
MTTRHTRALAANATAVVTFRSHLRNYTKLTHLTLTILEMFRSKQWRAYQSIRGPVRWLECEFDYFLIAQDAPYEDVVRVVGWERIGTELAPAMMGPEGRTRRSFAAAAAAWPGDTGEALLDRARRLGWLTPNEKTPTLRPAPVTSYARVVAREALPDGSRARRYRTRTLLADLTPARRAALEAEIMRLRRRYTVEELRYVREQLVPARRGRPRQAQVSAEGLRSRRRRIGQTNSFDRSTAAR